MIYPTISEYIEAIKYAEDNFATLTNLRSELDDDGHPIMSSGNFAVVFKMKNKVTGKLYAVKCFTREQKGRSEAYKLISEELELLSSNYFVPFLFLEKELFVISASSDETDYPILLMDWVEGVTLDKYIWQHLFEEKSIMMLTYNFCRLSSWLMSQPFAHGDIKPDNIIIRNDNSIVLVDYDGMYVPAMLGQNARELGSPGYMHPKRTLQDFDEHIDEFSISLIAMQLCAIYLNPTLYLNSHGDTLILSEKDIRNLGESHEFSKFNSLIGTYPFNKLLALFLLAYSEGNLSSISSSIYNIKAQFSLPLYEITTKVTDEDIAKGKKDEYGAIYSEDGLKLLKFNCSDDNYNVRFGTKIICDYASGEESWLCGVIERFTIPSTVIIIGYRAFYYCEHLKSINIPSSVIKICDEAFLGCSSIHSVTIPESVCSIDGNPFIYTRLTSIKCLSPFFEVDGNALYTAGKKKIISFYNRGLTDFDIPNSVVTIGKGAFGGNNSLKTINIASSVITISSCAFRSMNINSITIPSSVKNIGGNPFGYCSIKSITCLSPFFEIDGNALYTKGKKQLISLYNTDLTQFQIPDSVTNISDYAFEGCSSLQSIKIPSSVTVIGESAFLGCDSLTYIGIPSSVKKIGNYAFMCCDKLRQVAILSSVVEVGKDSFKDCKSLRFILTLKGDVNRIKTMLNKDVHFTLHEIVHNL